MVFRDRDITNGWTGSGDGTRAEHFAKRRNPNRIQLPYIQNALEYAKEAILLGRTPEQAVPGGLVQVGWHQTSDGWEKIVLDKRPWQGSAPKNAFAVKHVSGTNAGQTKSLFEVDRMDPDLYFQQELNQGISPGVLTRPPGVID